MASQKRAPKNPILSQKTVHKRILIITSHKTLICTHDIITVGVVHLVSIKFGDLCGKQIWRAFSLVI